MEYTKKFPNGRFRFERSGIFGRGDWVYVYMNGEKVDEFELSESDKEMIKTSESHFAFLCSIWYSDYGMDL